MTVKELREKRAKLVADARVLFDSIKADTPEADAKEAEGKFDTMMAEADSIKIQIDRAERLEASEGHLNERQTHAARARGISVEQQQDEDLLQNDAFSTYLRGGMSALTEDQRRIASPRFQAAQSTGSNTAGGYTVPQGFYGQMESAELAYGGMLEAAFVFDTDSGNQLPIPTDNDTSNSGAILQENVQAGQQDVTFGMVPLNAYTYTSKIVLVSNQLLQDSAFNLDSFLAEKLGTRIARATNVHFTTGDAASKPNGVVTASTLGRTGTTGQTATIIWDDLIELHHSVDPAYRRNARFMMADSTLKAIKKLKTGDGQYLWQSGVALKEPDTIDGKPYTINQDMAAMATSAKSVLFGDFKKYFIRRVKGVQVLRLVERYADFNQTGFVAFQRWDGNLVDAGTHPLKYYANAAS